MIAVKEITEQIRADIAQARIKTALEELVKLANQLGNADFLNQVILTSSAYHTLEGNVLIQDESADEDKNKIILALLSLVEDMSDLFPETIDYQIARAEENAEAPPKNEEVVAQTPIETTSIEEKMTEMVVENETEKATEPLPMGMVMGASAPAAPAPKSPIHSPAFNYFYANIENPMALAVPSEDFLKQAIVLYTFETTGTLPEKISEINGMVDDQDAFQAWIQTKRAFKSAELENKLVIKFTQTGQLTKMLLMSDGKLTEVSLRDVITHKWDGEWAIHQGILKITIGNYPTAVFASAEGITHAGVEYIENDRAIIHNLIVLPAMESVLYC
jgi:hypothetical protein